jgi:uncharacterized repeat protein (TIGR02543 family)
MKHAYYSIIGTPSLVGTSAVSEPGRKTLIFLALILLHWATSIQAAVLEFGNAGGIVLGVNGGAPYPSAVTVSGIADPVASIRVKLTGLTHSEPMDLDVFLVSPAGKVAALMSDGGGDGLHPMNNVNLVLDDRSPLVLPYGESTPSGSYRPVDNEPGELLPPATTGTIGTNITMLGDGGVNGVWKLYISNDRHLFTGTLTSWALVIETGPPTPRLLVEQTPGVPLINGMPVDFADLPLGTTADLDFKVTNLGNTALQFLGTPKVSLSGVDAGSFVISAQPSPTVSSSGGFTSFTVRFVPTTPGVKSAMVSFLTNDSDRDPFRIGLYGVGGQTQILHGFRDGTYVNDVSYPYGPLAIGGNTLYGGGTASGAGSGNGGIYKMNTDGTGYAVLHSFSGGSGDGSRPYSGVNLSGSTLYGMTLYGGAGSTIGNIGPGTIFKMTTTGASFSLLHVFSEGAASGGGLTLVGANLYGVQAGVGQNGLDMFSLTTSGTGFVKTHHFAQGDYNSYLVGQLVPVGGSFYGVMHADGTHDGGTIFKINANGTGYAVLHDFAGGSDGLLPHGGLSLSGSTLYGVTSSGGANDRGALFKINTDGTSYQVLLSFGNANTGGLSPVGPPLAHGGKIYGVTDGGGSTGGGVLFRVNPDGSDYRIVHSFGTLTDDGTRPASGPAVVGTSLFGTTNLGGGSNRGTIYKFDLGTPPVVFGTTVNVLPTLGGSVIGDGPTSAGAIASLVAVPKTGYVFTSWMETGTVISTSTSYSFTATSNRTLTANFRPLSGLETWRLSYFGESNNTGNGADLTDYDRDGLVNLVEYAFGLDPSKPGAWQLPVAQRLGENFVLSFTQPANITGITYGAQYTTSLSGGWTTVPDTGSGTIHTFSIPMVLHQKLFLRLVVNSP